MADVVDFPAAIQRLTQAELVSLAQAWAPRLGSGAGTGQPDQRWYCRLEHNEQYEVWLMGWSGTNRAQFHDHGGSSGAVYVLAGQLIETRLRHGGSVVRRAGMSGQVFSFARDVIHDIENVPGAASLSIHVYSPPLSTMTYYEADAEGVTPTQTVAVVGPEPGATDLTDQI